MYRRATTLTRWLGVVALVAAFALPAQAQRNVTLQLNTATIPDTVGTMSPENYLEVRGAVGGTAPTTLPSGEVIDWNDASQVEYTNIGGDYWEVSFQIPDDSELLFKNWSQEISSTPDINGGWETGNNNYSIAAGTGDVTRPLHYFNATGGDQDYEWRPFGAEGDSVAVWFRVYMNTEDAVGNYNRDGENTIGVRGDATLGGSQDGGATTIDWGATNVILTRESEDDTVPGYDLYSGRVAFPASAVGQLQNYKFFIEPSGWEGPDTSMLPEECSDDNRCFTVPTQDSTLHWVYYGDSAPLAGEDPVQKNVVFQVDTEPLSDAGILDLTRGDVFQVRGSFNDWGCPDDNQDRCALFQSTGTLNFGNSISITAVPQTEIEYKYFVVLQDVDQDEFGDFGYEEPLDYGGGNRSFTFEGTDDQVLGTEFFNSIRAGNAIGSDEGEIDVTFRVDMTEALSYAGEDAFDPSEDTVYVAFEDRIWQRTQGYAPDSLTDGVDPGFWLESVGDNIYEGTYTVRVPTYNGIGYRYRWGSALGEGGTVAEGTGGNGQAGRRRYRYIMPDGNGDFPSAYTFAMDIVVDASSLNEWECNPTDPLYETKVADGFCRENGFVWAVGIEEVGGAQPEVALLSANYPNPFRDATTFEYATAESGPVRLEVYDLTGRRVALLVDEVQPASTYRVGFDAPGLASGVYFVRLQASGTVLSRKITVMN